MTKKKEYSLDNLHLDQDSLEKKCCLQEGDCNDTKTKPDPLPTDAATVGQGL